jgi:putative membrane protein
VRAWLVAGTVLVGYAISVAHAAVTRGVRAVGALMLITTGGGFAVEAVGLATGFPFGRYAYTTALGPRLLGVPLLIPLAWTWMAWPAWLVAGRLTSGRRLRPGRRLRSGRRPRSGRRLTSDRRLRSGVLRILLAGLGLAAWDLFLDPQMVAEGYWVWRDPRPSLPGAPDVPLSNYLGWLVVAVALMALLSLSLRQWSIQRDPGRADRTGSTIVYGAARSAMLHADPLPATLRADAPMYALYLWTYASAVLAHAVFLGLPASALWGGIGMGLVAVPLAVALAVGSGRRSRSTAAGWRRPSRSTAAGWRRPSRSAMR